MNLESEKLLGRLVVEAGLLNPAEFEVYFEDVRSGRRAPGSLLPLLSQTGRMSADAYLGLRQRWLELQRNHSGVVARSPAEAEIAKLARSGLLNILAVQSLRSAMSGWASQGHQVGVRDAVVYLGLASGEAVDHALQAGGPQRSAPQGVFEQTFSPQVPAARPALGFPAIGDAPQPLGGLSPSSSPSAPAPLDPGPQAGYSPFGSLDGFGSQGAPASPPAATPFAKTLSDAPQGSGLLGGAPPASPSRRSSPNIPSTTAPPGSTSPSP